MKGFAVIEILISLVISSFLAIALYNIVLQLQDSEGYVDQTVTVGSQITIIAERFQKDFNGMFWPELEQVKRPGSGKCQIPYGGPLSICPFCGNKAVEGGKIIPIEETNKMTGRNDSEAPAQIKLLKVIYSQNQSDGLLKELSFITCNPLQIYGENKPRVMRVIYSLVQESGAPGSFKLQRQQSVDLDYQAAKTDTPSFAVASGIRALGMTYFYQETPKDGKQAEGEPKLDKHTELEVNYDPLAKDDKSKDDKASKLVGKVPKYIKVEISLWQDARQKDFTDFELWYTTYEPVAVEQLKENNSNKVEQPKEPKSDKELKAAKAEPKKSLIDKSAK